MQLTKLVHLGGINHEETTLYTVVKSSRNEIINELNNWLFDYQYAHERPISKLIQLPPMDDWTHSQEDRHYWYIDFPQYKFHIWIKSEYIDFK